MTNPKTIRTGSAAMFARPCFIAVVLCLACFQTLAQFPDVPGDWPQWRGAKRDGVSNEKGLMKSWLEGGPKLLWTNRDMGVGHAGPALAGERLYIMGDIAEGCCVMALDRNTGKLIWKSRVGESGGNSSYPGPRATPSIVGDLLVTETQYGDVLCLNLADGKRVWSVNMEKDLGGVRPMWHFGEAPLVDAGRVICTPGGEKGTLAALDLKTGKLLWRSADLTDNCTYVSPVAADFGGVRQYVQMTPKNVAGVDASSGKVLWMAPRVGERAIVPTPVVAGNNVYVTSGYGMGCNMFAIDKASAGFHATPVYSSKQIASHHGGVVQVGKHLYGFSEPGGWVCQDFETGAIVWSNPGIGKGSVTAVDGSLYCRSEEGLVSLVRATPDGYQETGRFKQPERSTKKAWPHPVIAGGNLYLRDQSVLLCYEVKAAQ